MALAGYIKFDGIEGECSEAAHENWVEVKAWKHEGMQEASPTQVDNGGPAAAKTEHTAFQLTKRIDQTSPYLWEKLSRGAVIKKVSFEMMRPDGVGGQIKVWEVILDTVIVSKISMTGAQAGDDVPTEEVHLKYGNIQWSYQTQGRGGDAGGAIVKGYSLIKNKDWSA